jgi:lipopolysaccharide export system permease protein
VKIIHRYIFLSVGSAAAAGAALFIFVLVAANAVRDVIERVASGQLTLTMAGEMVALLVPFTLSFAAPMGLLIGILVVLGRMSAQNEVTALRSAGLSLWRMGAAIYLLAVIAAGGCAFINNYYAPVARTQYRTMLADLVHEAPLRFIVPGRFVRDFPGYVIYAGERRDQELTNVWIWVLGRDRTVEKFLQARRGSITYDADRNLLLLDVYEATGESRSAANAEDLSRARPVAVIAHASFALPMDRLMSAQKAEGVKKFSNMSLAELMKARRDARNAQWDAEYGSGAWSEARVQATRAEFTISRNFAFAFSSLALAFVGIPLGIKVGRKETYANMAVALALGMLYFFLTFLAGWAEKTPQAFPQLLVWLPNVAFFITGLLLMRRSNAG